MAHILGGVQNGKRVLPCLYDHNLQAQRGTFRNYYQFCLINVGYFDPMSCHFYKFNQPPPGPCSWTKLRLNWINPSKIITLKKGETKTLELGPLMTQKSSVLAVKIEIDPKRYYLIENRQPISLDVNLPSHGILIYACDDDVAECFNHNSPIKLKPADTSLPELAGAPYNPGKNDTYTDPQNNIKIKVLEKNGENMKIIITPAK